MVISGPLNTEGWREGGGGGGGGGGGREMGEVHHTNRERMLYLIHVVPSEKVKGRTLWLREMSHQGHHQYLAKQS